MFDINMAIHSDDSACPAFNLPHIITGKENDIVDMINPLRGRIHYK